MKNKAFTLIELLVVVLIIGILAAVALPQYQKTVARTKIANVLIVGRDLRNASLRFFSENGSFPCEGQATSYYDFSALDVTPPDSIPGYAAFYYTCNSIFFHRLSPPLDMVYPLIDSPTGNGLGYPLTTNDVLCRVYDNSITIEKDHALCKSLGKVVYEKAANASTYYWLQF